MADTVLNLIVEAGKDFFHVYDRTGKYKKKKNEGGWGSPNDKLSDVKSGKVRIYLPKETTYLKEIDVTQYLPNDTCLGYEILPEDLGLDIFDPGVYRFEFIVEKHNGKILAEDCFIFYYEPLECCISKKKMETNPNDASSDLAKKVIELETLLKNAKWCACSGKLDCAQDISDYIWTNCGCSC